VSFLFDTNVLSELRKKQRQNPQVAAFAKAVGWNSISTSWIVMAELRRGAALVSRHDPKQAEALESWIEMLHRRIGDRILPVDGAVAAAWVTLMVPNPRSPLDALIAATALAHGLTLVTRNVRDFAGAGIDLLDPWAFAP
jgi:predicted nucleic acid-binding protein